MEETSKVKAIREQMQNSLFNYDNILNEQSDLIDRFLTEKPSIFVEQIVAFDDGTYDVPYKEPNEIENYYNISLYNDDRGLTEVKAIGMTKEEDGQIYVYFIDEDNIIYRTQFEGVAKISYCNLLELLLENDYIELMNENIIDF